MNSQKMLMLKRFIFLLLVCFVKPSFGEKELAKHSKLGNKQEIAFTKIKQEENSIISVTWFKKSSEKHQKDFQALEGFEIGLTEGFRYGIRDYTDPFWIGRGTAAGDYNRDGWQDIIFGSNHGFILYKNVGGQFELQIQPNEKIKQLMVFAVAFVDMNNDGWLDIFFTTFNQGNYIIINKQGTFDFQHLTSVPNQNAVLTLSPGFSDIDLNGQLDIVNGNIALGVVTGMGHIRGHRTNSMTFNNNLTFRDVAMEKTSGETMAILVSDINNDNITDIYFGNDFIAPDSILLGTGKGYKKITGNKFIPFTPFFSMGADTGDINNDLLLDFVITGTMYMAPFVGKHAIDGKSVAEYSDFKGGLNTCSSIKDISYRENCEKVRDSNYINALDSVENNELLDCQAIKNETQNHICKTQQMWQLITKTQHNEDCNALYKGDSKLLEVCKILQFKGEKYERKDLYGAIPQDDRNMLYAFDKNQASFNLVTGFTHPGGWTWNSKIVDLDNDGWQDVISSDGTVRKDDYGWNVLMKNIDGKRFEQKQFSAGVTSNFSLFSFALIDMDNDGDLDIIGNSAEGPVQVYRNFSSKNNHSIAVSLIDQRGNHDAIGSKITIYYEQGKKSQIREIKASGGYMSFDPAIAYFGLSDTRKIDKIDVLWPDKSNNIYEGPFKTDGHYRIERLKTN